MVVAESCRSGQQWNPGTAQQRTVINVERTSLAGGRRPTTTPRDVGLSQPMLTPDDAYFFQKQQHGRPQPPPRVPTRLGPRPMIVPNASSATARCAPASGLAATRQVHGTEAEEADRLHDEVRALRLLMRGYDEAPSMSKQGGWAADSSSRPSSRGSPRRAGVGSEQPSWQRPSSSAASGQSLSARSGGPPLRFAFRESTPRAGQSTLSDLPSRRSAPHDATPQQQMLLLQQQQWQWHPHQPGGFGFGGMEDDPRAQLYASSSRFEHAEPESLATAALARAAAEAGVVPAFAVSSDAGIGGLKARGAAFQSNAVRFAVTMAERLEQTEAIKSSSPSTDGCYTSLAVLREMVALVGPLGPVLQNVHDALQLCLLSPHHYSDGMFMDDGESPAMRTSTDAALERHAAATRGRVPFFVLVRKLEEAAAALRNERDGALEDVARNVIDLGNLEEQLATAKSSLQTKTATIDKLVRASRRADPLLASLALADASCRLTCKTCTLPMDARIPRRCASTLSWRSSCTRLRKSRAKRSRSTIACKLSAS